MKLTTVCDLEIFQREENLNLSVCLSLSLSLKIPLRKAFSEVILLGGCGRLSHLGGINLWHPMMTMGGFRKPAPRSTLVARCSHKSWLFSLGLWLEESALSRFPSQSNLPFQQASDVLLGVHLLPVWSP